MQDCLNKYLIFAHAYINDDILLDILWSNIFQITTYQIHQLLVCSFENKSGKTKLCVKGVLCHIKLTNEIL